ncbi:YabP/YqfC family sporulation protein [uncultured Oscillibacter sp.]|uniref:YabP/YqfC family sporulation protein n=1 Tax=uncultured Oscillibacter sp. TaxID=876091 RepID=UPI0026395CE1|nr:YabP/YqfC family sporulation protein [uncultured Oscillibacter sp.]
MERDRKSERRSERKGDRKNGGFLGEVAELFDLPADIVAGLPRMEMIGGRQLYLERHTGLLSYSETRIDANTAVGVLRVKGSRLTLMAMTAEEMRIGGRIDAVEWVGAEEG